MKQLSPPRLSGTRSVNLFSGRANSFIGRFSIWIKIASVLENKKPSMPKIVGDRHTVLGLERRPLSVERRTHNP